MKASELTLLGLLFATNVAAQTTGTPTQLRVNVDVFGNLIVASAAQTAPLTTTTFSNARLRVDANGNLVVALNGPSLFPDGTQAAPSISFASQPDMGFFRPSANIINYVVANTLYAQLNGNGFNLTRDNSFMSFGISGDTTLTRIAAGKLQLAGTTPMILMGGATNSFPALKQVSTGLYVRAADDSGYGIFGSGQYQLGGNTLITVNAPTISSGFGTSPAILSNNGNATFRVNVGTGGVATSGVVALGATVANGWNCLVSDMTNNTVTRQTASTTSTVTVTAAAAWAASDTLIFHCMGY